MNYNDLRYNGISLLRVCVVYCGGEVFYILILRWWLCLWYNKGCIKYFIISVYNFMFVILRKWLDEIFM